MQKKKLEKRKSKSRNVRLEKEKRMRRFRIIKLILKILIIIGLLACLIAYAFTSPIFNINEIRVIGNEKFSEEEYIELSKLNIGQNIFNFSKIKVTSDIKSNAYVESVKIRRKLPTKVEITIEERTATYQILVEDEFIYINNQGYILEKSKDKLPLTIITGISTEIENIIEGKRLSNNDLEKLQNIIQIKDTINSVEINGNLSSIDITNKYDYILNFEEEAKQVHLGNTNDLRSKISSMKRILEDQKGVPGVIYLNKEQKYFSPK